MADYKSLAVIILAAGQGKRMGNPERAKVLTPLNNKPLLGYVLDSTAGLDPTSVVVIIGHQREAVQQYVAQTLPLASCAVQHEQRGTGHAVQQAHSALRSHSGDVLILSGDVPLLSSNTLQSFVSHHRTNGAHLTVLSARVPNPTGYGRIVKDAEGRLQSIVEHKDASEKVRAIDEINTGVYLVDATELFTALESVDNNNAQGEFYLTDIAEILRSKQKHVHVFELPQWQEALGINTPEDLLEAEQRLQTIEEQ